MQISPPEESDALDALFETIHGVDGVPALTEHKWVRRTEQVGARHVVARCNGTVAGYAQAAHHPGAQRGEPGHWAIEFAIDPAYRTVDVVDALIGASVALVPAGEPFVVWTWHEDVAERLEHAGLRESRRLQRLERRLPIDEAAILPLTVDVTPFEVGRDEAAWLAVNNAAFAGHPENGALRREDLEGRYALTWFDPEDILMAWEEQELVGSCWTKRHPGGIGEIYIIGVAPHAQGRGLGRSLILLGLAHLHWVGAKTGMLYVDADNAAAMWLYSDLGFRPVWSNRQYEVPA